MKKILVAFCLFLLFPSYSVVWPAETYKLDGYKWNRMDKWEKLGFVEGWWLAGEHAIIVMGLLRDEVDINIKMKEYRRIINLGITTGLSFWGLTWGQLIETIDKLYSDLRLKTWEINEIMWFVRGRLMEGWTEKDLDEIIAFELRRKILSNRTKSAFSQDESNKLQIYQEYLDYYNKYMPQALKDLSQYLF